MATDGKDVGIWKERRGGEEKSDGEESPTDEVDEGHCERAGGGGSKGDGEHEGHWASLSSINHMLEHKKEKEH